MDLKNIQTSIFNALIGKTTATEPLSLIQSDAKADASTRFEIYQTGHRIRLQEALNEDFPVSTELWDSENFETAFGQFVQESASPTFNLNEFGQHWLVWLKKNQIKDWPHWLIPLSQFEWNLVEARYQAYTRKPNQRMALDEQSSTWVEFAPAVQIQHYSCPVDLIYNQRSAHDEKYDVSVIIWESNSDIHFERLEPLPAKLWNLLLTSQNMIQFQEQAMSFVNSESQLSVEVHKIFEFGSRHGILNLITT